MALADAPVPSRVVRLARAVAHLSCQVVAVSQPGLVLPSAIFAQNACARRRLQGSHTPLPLFLLHAPPVLPELASVLLFRARPLFLLPARAARSLLVAWPASFPLLILLGLGLLVLALSNALARSDLVFLPLVLRRGRVPAVGVSPDLCRVRGSACPQQRRLPPPTEPSEVKMSDAPYFITFSCLPHVLRDGANHDHSTTELAAPSKAASRSWRKASA